MQTRLEPILHGGILDATLRLLQTIFVRETYTVVHGLLSCFEVNILLDLLRSIFKNRPVPELYEGILVDPDIAPKMIENIERVTDVLKRSPQPLTEILDLREVLRKEFPDTITSFQRIQSVLLRLTHDVSKRYMKGTGGADELRRPEVELDGFEKLQQAFYADNEADDGEGPPKRDLNSLIQNTERTAGETKSTTELIIKAPEMVCDEFKRNDRLASREHTRQPWAVKNGRLVKLQNISHF